MLDELLGGVTAFRQGHGHKDYRSGGHGFQEKKQFVSHVEAEGGYFDRQAGYDHRMRLPANHVRPMTRMTIHEEDSDGEEFFESSRSRHTNAFAHHSNNHHHQQPPHGNFMHPPHHNGKMGHGWQGQHGGAYPGGHGMQHHGEHGMQHHDMHGMHHQGGHGMQHQGGGFGLKYDKYTAAQVPPRNGYMNPNYGQKVGWGNKGL